jgi:hypothetical protein
MQGKRHKLKITVLQCGPGQEECEQGAIST